MAHDATVVAGIRQVRDDVLGLICDGNMLRSEISDQRWHQFDFEGYSCLECGQQPSGLLRIVEHQRTPSTIEASDSAIANDREYGRAGKAASGSRQETAAPSDYRTSGPFKVIKSFPFDAVI